jgi:hypothetical protein
MASISEILIGQASKSIESTANQTSLADAISGGVKNYAQIAQIAQQREQLEQAKQDLQLRKEQVYLQKINSLGESYQLGLGIKDPKMQNLYFTKTLQAKATALGLTDLVSPEVGEMIAKSNEGKAKMQGLLLDVNSKVERGELKGTQIPEYIKSITQDVESFISYYGEQLAASQQFATKEAGDLSQAQAAAGAAVTKQTQAQQAATKMAEENVQREITKQTESARIKELNAAKLAFDNFGGKEVAETKIKALENVLADLESGKLKTGTSRAALSSFAGKSAGAFISPALKAAQDATAGSIDLNAALGTGTKTEQEVLRAESRIFDQNLPPEANIAKLKATIARDRAILNKKLKEFGGDSAPLPAPANTDKIQRYTELLNNARSPEDKQKIINSAKKAGINLGGG